MRDYLFYSCVNWVKYEVLWSIYFLFVIGVYVVDGKGWVDCKLEVKWG